MSSQWTHLFSTVGELKRVLEEHLICYTYRLKHILLNVVLKCLAPSGGKYKTMQVSTVNIKQT